MEINITNEDCMELMRRTPDKFYDLAVVDPEYGVGAAAMGMGRTGKGLRTTNHTRKEWDNNPPPPEYWTELFRVSKAQIIWGANYFGGFLPPARNWIVWDKRQPEGVTFAMHELAFCNVEDAKPMIFRHSPSESKNNISNSDRRQATANSRIHPTQKPVALYEWLLRNYAKPGQTILDTHMGSGSIAIAAYNMGFDLTACELDTDYYNAAMKRIEAHIQKHPRGEDLLPKRVTLNNQLPLEFFTQ